MPLVEATAVEVYGAEPLTEEELLALLELHAADAGRLGTGMNFLKRVRTSHHNLARALVSGLSQTEAAVQAGYSLSRTSILMRDPAFQELLAWYREQALNSTLDLTIRMNSVAADILDEIHERLEDDPEQFSPKDLRETFASLADRSGYGPTRKLEVDNKSQARKNELERLKAAVRQSGTTKVIREGAVTQDNQGPARGLVHGPDPRGTEEEAPAGEAPVRDGLGSGLREEGIPTHKALVPFTGGR